jgi:hypothetical protein
VAEYVLDTGAHLRARRVRRLLALCQRTIACGALGRASVHFSLVIAGYEHRKAGVAESVIEAVLILWLTLTSLGPTWTRAASPPEHLRHAARCGAKAVPIGSGGPKGSRNGNYKYGL